MRKDSFYSIDVKNNTVCFRELVFLYNFFLLIEFSDFSGKFNIMRMSRSGGNKEIELWPLLMSVLLVS